MPTDGGVFLRLKSAIDATLTGLPDRTNAAKALGDAYATFRCEAARVADDEGVTEEFGRLFPPPAPIARPSVNTFDPITAASDANDAFSLLARLSGWLNGFVQQVRLEGEAKAYAEARARQERRPN